MDVSKSNDADYMPPERYKGRKNGGTLPAYFNTMTLENTKFLPMNIGNKEGGPN
jgi:hypothetical protein